MANEFIIKNGFVSKGDSIILGNLSGQTFNIINTPVNNNSATEILVRNTTTGDVEYRNSSTLGGGGGGQTITGYTYNESNNTFTIGLSGGTSFDTTINVVSGLTVTNDLIVSGSTGIGTDTPTEKLHIKSTTKSKIKIEADINDADETDTADILLSQDGGISTANFGMSPDVINDLVIGVNSTSPPSIKFATRSDGTTFSTTADTKMTLSNDGNLGIGTIDPTEKLHVSGGDILIETSNGKFYTDLDATIGPVVRLSGVTTDLAQLIATTEGSLGIAIGSRGSAEAGFPGYGKNKDGFIYSSSAQNGLNIISSPGTNTEDYIRFYAGNDVDGTTANIFIAGSGSTKGYVGIDTETPTEKLHVEGSVRIVDGTEQLGYVLTCDADGVASWQPSSGGTSGSTVYWSTENGGLKSNISSFTGSINGTSTGALIAGGASNNKIFSGFNSTIINGSNNIISGSTASAILSSQNSLINSNPSALSDISQATIVGGLSNTIEDTTLQPSERATIVGGSTNIIDGGLDSSIIGGSNNTITQVGSGIYTSVESVISGGSRSAIVGGTGNILDASYSVILGGQNITGTTNNTVYTPNLNVILDSQLDGDLFVSGSTGIGTDTPTEKLDVRGDVLFSNPTNNTVLTISATSLNDSIIDFENTGVSTPFARVEGNTFGGGIEGNLQFYTFPTGGPLSEVMVLTSTQRVGIGNILNNDVDKTLHVMGDFKMEETTAIFDSNLNLSSGANVRLSAITTDQIPRISVESPGDGGISIGARGSTEASFPGYGANGDGYIYSSIDQNGLNIISAPSSPAGTLPDYIRMYAGQDVSGGIPDIHIQGRATADSVRGYVGIHTDTPSETLHVDGTVRIVDGTEQLGYVLTCDADGVASWQPSSGGTSGSTVYWEEGGEGNSLYDIKGDHILTGSSRYSMIAGGEDNRITSHDSSGIFVGKDNVLTGSSIFTETQNAIIGGTNNTISSLLGYMNNTLILGGNNNSISGRINNSVMVGGTNHIINNSINDSVIIGGNGSTVDGSRNVVLGGASMTGNTGNDTVFVPKLNIRDVSNGTPTMSLGVDSNGLVVSAATGADSGNCITDLWVTNLESCSPLNINTQNQGNVYVGNDGGLPKVTLDITTPNESSITFDEESFMKYKKSQKELIIGEPEGGGKVKIEVEGVDTFEVSKTTTKINQGDLEAEAGNIIIKSGNNKTLIIEAIPDVGGANLGTDVDGKLIDLPSDSRVKVNIQEIDEVVNPLEFMKSIKGYQFEYDPRTRISKPGTKHYGFKVDDFREGLKTTLDEKINPDEQIINDIGKTLVKTCKTKYNIGKDKLESVDAMNYVDLIPFMVESIKKLDTNIDNINTDGGNDGVGITTTIDNEDGTFTFNYSNGTSFTTSNLKGESGENGADGLQGIQGAKGADGKNGNDGLQGIQGKQGAKGDKGDPGTNGSGTDTYVISGQYNSRDRDIILTLNNGDVVSIPFTPTDNNNFITSGRIDGDDLILTDNNGVDSATIDISNLGGDDKYLDSTSLPLDSNHPNVNQLTLEMNDGTQHSVDMSGFRNDSNTAHRKLGVNDATNQSPIIVTGTRQTITVRHDLGEFYPLFIIYEVTRGEVVLPFGVGVPNSTGAIPANNVTGPHTLDTIDITFESAGTYIVKFVG